MAQELGSESPMAAVEVPDTARRRKLEEEKAELKADESKDTEETEAKAPGGLHGDTGDGTFVNNDDGETPVKAELIKTEEESKDMEETKAKDAEVLVPIRCIGMDNATEVPIFHHAPEADTLINLDCRLGPYDPYPAEQARRRRVSREESP